jgi:glc operon protein GlcG
MNTYRTIQAITYASAANAVAVGIATAERRGVKAVVTVMDPSLVPVAVGRADGAPPHSLETSRRKAITSASMRKPSGAIPAELVVAFEHGSGGLLTSIRGGVPVAFDGVHVAGLGIAGGTPQQDVEIAAATLSAIGADEVDMKS